MERKTRCLLLLPRPVFPLVCGYALKNYNLIRILAGQYRLKVVIIAEEDILEEEKKFYSDLGIWHLVHRIPKHRGWLNALKGLFSTKPLQVCYYYDARLQEKIRPLVEESDVLIAALVRTREYLAAAGDLAGKKLVFDMADSIALNYQRSKDKTRSWFWRLLYSVEGGRLLKYERDCIQHSCVTYLFNPEEQVYWGRYGNVKWLPHGVDNGLFLYGGHDASLEGSVVFLGKMDYQPNVDAVLWYLEHVQSRVGERIPFVVVGAYPTKRLQDYARTLPNVTVTGFVEDPYLYAASALAVVAPMQTGGGIQNKVLEGMALGKVNIVSSLAARPIVGAQAGKHILVADTPEEYEAYLMDMVDGIRTYEDVGANARRLVQGRYTWKSYGDRYLGGIHEAAANV